MKVLKITTDDKTEILDVEKMSYEFLAPLIGCDYIEVVRPARLYSYLNKKRCRDYGDRGLCMLVDESGLLKEKPKVNTFASWLYRMDMHGNPIVGDVLIVAEEYTLDGIDLAPLDDEEARSLCHEFKEILSQRRTKNE